MVYIDYMAYLLKMSPRTTTLSSGDVRKIQHTVFTYFKNPF